MGGGEEKPSAAEKPSIGEKPSAAGNKPSAAVRTRTCESEPKIKIIKIIILIHDSASKLAFLLE